MESKKTESNKKPGWDAKNQVLTDNFGNVYDFKNKTINGGQFKFIYNSEVKFKGDECRFTTGYHEVPHINFGRYEGYFPNQSISFTIGKNYKLSEFNSDNFPDGHEEGCLEESGQCKTCIYAPADIRFDYADDKLKSMQVSGQDIYNPITKCFSNKEVWFDTNETILKIVPKKPNSNDYDQEPAFEKKFPGEKIEFVDQIGRYIYFYQNKINQGLLHVYDTKYNKIETTYETQLPSKDFNMDDLKNVVRLMQQKDCNHDFNQAYSKYLKSKTANYNMNTPSRKGPYRGG